MESLLSDEMLLERSKIWATVMAKYNEKETFKDIEFNEIQSKSEEEISDDDAPNITIIISDDDAPNQTNNNDINNTTKTSKALVKVDNFEGDTSSDDFDECANKTIALLKEHQSKWKKSGMMDILETFDLDKISKVVQPWVEKNKLDKSLHSTSVDEHIVHIEEHHHQRIHHLAASDDDDSLHSIDTANYIRSSRKNKRSSCTTTTIKKFSYVKGSRKQLQKKYGLGGSGFDLNKDLVEKVFCEKYSMENRCFRDIKSFEKKNNLNFTPTSRHKPVEYAPRSLPATKKRKSRQIKRRSDTSKRSVSSSSSSGGASPVRHPKPKFKRRSQHVNKLVGTESELEHGKSLSPPSLPPKPRIPVALTNGIDNRIDVTQMQTSDSESQMDTKKPLNQLLKPLQEHPKTTQTAQSASPSNETGFLCASIINSTALSYTNQPSSAVPYPMKKCLITPIKNKPSELENQTETINIKPLRVKVAQKKTKVIQEKVEEKVAKEIEQPKDVPQKDNSKILLYCPANLEPHQKNLINKRFYLTQDYFLEMVGKKNSRRFIKLNSRKFPFEFNCTSRIYFKIPEESGESSGSSDEDILYIFGREGKLIVETAEQRNVVNAI